MSRFLSAAAARLAPYTPGEQPRDTQYIKLNTNESPYPPSPEVVKAVTGGEAERLRLYSDPTCKALVDAAADCYGLRPEQILVGNGSDENLAFAFRALCDENHGLAFADITYGFYKVWASLWNVPARIVPLDEDFNLNVDDYVNLAETVVIANPNAPTGIPVPLCDIRRLLEVDRNRVVIVDEAYVDFGGESSLSLLESYDNLLVVQTMSKSRSLAGARLGLCFGSAELIADLNRVKYSFNPYNVNRLSMLAGKAALEDDAYFQDCTARVRETREWTATRLRELGFQVLPSVANFLFVRREGFPGGELYRELKEKGILVRWFDAKRIDGFVRVTIGAPADMETFITTLQECLEGRP